MSIARSTRSMVPPPRMRALCVTGRRDIWWDGRSNQFFASSIDAENDLVSFRPDRIRDVTAVAQRPAASPAIAATGVGHPRRPRIGVLYPSGAGNLGDEAIL